MPNQRLFLHLKTSSLLREMEKSSPLNLDYPPLLVPQMPCPSFFMQLFLKFLFKTTSKCLGPETGFNLDLVPSKVQRPDISLLLQKVLQTETWLVYCYKKWPHMSHSSLFYFDQIQNLINLSSFLDQCTYSDPNFTPHHCRLADNRKKNQISSLTLFSVSTFFSFFVGVFFPAEFEDSTSL